MRRPTNYILACTHSIQLLRGSYGLSQSCHSPRVDAYLFAKGHPRVVLGKKFLGRSPGVTLDLTSTTIDSIPAGPSSLSTPSSIPVASSPAICRAYRTRRSGTRLLKDIASTERPSTLPRQPSTLSQGFSSWPSRKRSSGPLS